MNKSQDIGDFVLSTAAVVQFFLVLLQILLIAIGVSEDASTKYRILLSAVPVIVSFYFILKRRARLTLVVYMIAIAVIIIHSIIFPNNIEFIKQSAFRFLLPICIPSLLSFAAIKRFDIFLKVIEVISWASFLLLLIYLSLFLTGRIFIGEYDMSMSYGLLLPTIILYNKKTFISILASFLIFISILAIGSRGPAFIVLAYVIYDVLTNEKKYLFISLVSIFLMSSTLILFNDFLFKLGIESRTLSLLFSGEIGQDSGRSYLYDNILEAYISNPIWGLGIFGDRVLLNGTYCHNLILELLINFGIIITTLIILILSFYILKVLLNLSPREKNIYVAFFLSGVIPLMFSGSYLEDVSFYSFLGLTIFFYKNIVNSKNIINKLNIKSD